MKIYAVENFVICRGNASYQNEGMPKLSCILDYRRGKERNGGGGE